MYTIVVISMFLMACSGKKDNAQGSASGMEPPMGEAMTPDAVMQAENAAMKVENKIDEKKKQAQGLLDPNKNLDMATYKKLLLDHAQCEIQNDAIDPKCPAVKALQDAMSGSRMAADLAGGAAALGKELLGHESPAVRIKAAGLMASIMGTSAESQELIVEAAKKEKHPAVLRAMVRTVANDGAKNPKVAEMLLSMASHESPTVRREVVFALSSTWNREMKGGPEKLAEMMEKDADMEVRKAACEYAGRLGDEKLIPAYTKLTADPDEILRGSCLKGVVAMWWSFPFHDTTSQKAYKLTLSVLKKKPRTKNFPLWTVPGTFKSINADKFAEWQKKAPWYKQAELMAVLTDLVKDGNVNWLGRVGAVESLAKLGAKKAELEKLRKSFGEPKGDDVHVANALDKAITTAP